MTLQPALQCPHPPASRPRCPCRTLGTESDHRAPAVAVWAGSAGVAAPHTHGRMDGRMTPNDKVQPQKFPPCC